MTRLATIAALFLIGTACGKSAVGEYCTDSKSCADGTSCVLAGGRSFVDGGLTCDAAKKLCSVTCGVDGDCASLGAGYICVKDCFMGSCLKGSR